MDEKILGVGLLVVLLMALGFFGYMHYSTRQYSQHLQERGVELRAKAAA